MVVQYVINGYRFVIVAGFYQQIIWALEMAATSFGFAIATFAGQNLGQEMRTYQRRCPVLGKMAVGTACAISVIMMVFGRKILILYITGDSQEVETVLNVAYKYLVIMVLLLSVLYLLHVYRSALQSMGDTVMPMVSGIVRWL